MSACIGEPGLLGFYPLPSYWIPAWDYFTALGLGAWLRGSDPQGSKSLG